MDELSRLLIGEDPNPIEHHWQRMHRHGFWRGGVVLGSAISGIDQALWDIKGKRLGVPVYELLGGPTRQRVRLYTHIRGATPEATAEHVQGWWRRGITAFKMGVPRAAPVADERALLRVTVARVEAVRRAVGDDVDLVLDNHGQLRRATRSSWSGARAVRPDVLRGAGAAGDAWTRWPRSPPRGCRCGWRRASGCSASGTIARC